MVQYFYKYFYEKKMRNIKVASLFILAVSVSLLVGCGSGSGSGSGGRSGGNNYSSSSNGYYDSTKANVNNLASTDNRFSAYNGQNSIEIKNIPVDPSGEVLYACLITNPNSTPITDLTLVPPLVTGNVRANIDPEQENNETVLGEFPFRENLSLKARLKEDLYNEYLKNEANNKKFATRASVNHQDEAEGQTDIIIPVLKNHNGGYRNCTLAKVSNHGKFFLDQNGDKAFAAPNISDESLNEFALEFDNYIYPILKEYFGNETDNFWRDVDGDGKLSIVFSPVVNNYGDAVVGIFENSNLNDRQYARDTICVAVCENDYNKWFMDARETICHEMQHIVNFSAKTRGSETLWIDEGLAVCSEILYRQKRHKEGLPTYSLYYGGIVDQDFAGNDARFYYSAYYLPEISLTSFEANSNDTNTTLAHYGQKGLFFFYLYEQYGKKALRQLCQGERGTDKFSILDRTLEELFIDFNIAILNEKLRNVVLSDFEVNPYSLASSKHCFIENMNLNYIYTGSSFIETPASYIEQRFNRLDVTQPLDMLKNSKGHFTIPAYGGIVRFFFKQPKNFSNILHTSQYTLTFNSSKPIVVNMVRSSK